ncbi:MAG TPA: hypothetical protein H9867_00545 [Candidatus Corynebacterium gallistercoris]|uniref:LGFP repeat-containing protein n=1 Tax=Candidatus Corynebacterium gallistercoris TaxID=2838530 RepID=A0A9D1RVK5_9CORY|nr:hypothetical protein [Candidatus Corynebacterium gallistercoris]
MKVLGKSLLTAVTVVCTAVGGAQVAGAQDRQVLIDSLYPQQVHDAPIGDGGDGVGNSAGQVAPGREDLEPLEPGFDDNRIDNQAGQGWVPTVDPSPVVVSGAMRSDREEIPGGFTKEEADLAEVQEARERLGAAGFERAGGVLPQGVAEAFVAAPVNCRTYWPSPYRVCGAIRKKYDSLGGPASFLTWPRSDEVGVPDGVGRRNEFVNGFIYWHPDTGAHAVSTHFSWVWNNLGWESGPLGYPMEDEVAVGDGLGRKQVFQGGHIYGSLAGLGSVRGRILERWLELGGPTGVLGYPLGDEAGTPDGRGRFSRFTGGMMYWTQETDAHFVTGAIQEIWALSGYERGEYGYPVEDGGQVVNGSVQQQFSRRMLNIEEYIGTELITLPNGKPINSVVFNLTGKEYFNEILQYYDVGATVRENQGPGGPGNQIPKRTVVSPIPVPSIYRYDPNWHGTGDSLNDYCTWSPDDFRPADVYAPAADFRGPCANHDMCYEAVNRGTRDRGYCDSKFLRELYYVCSHVYDRGSGVEGQCRSRAELYYSAVRKAHGD